MKRNSFVIAVLAASVAAAGLTAWGVSKLADGTKSDDAKVVRFADGSVGNHFTSYDRDNYPDLTYAAENAVQAVVNIEKIEEVSYGATSGGMGPGPNPFFEFFGIPDDNYQQPRQQPKPRELRSGGSGVIISPDGYIVTNNHVIDNASKLKVRLYDNRVFDATLIGTDPATDVALIKIESSNLPTLVFGNSDDLRLGEWVLAIGSPFDLQSTVTAGIVSAKARDMRGIPGQLSITSFIQTDAAVNPGNSGGALVNVRGEVVGINTMIKSPTGSFAGYSFAVPSSIVQKVVVDLKEFGTVQRGLLGIEFQAVDNGKIYDVQKQEEVDVKEQKGLYIANVLPESGAEAAGLKKGDIIVEIDGIAMENSATLQEYVATKRPNDKIKVSVKRDGNLKQFDVVLRNKVGKAELLPRGYTEASAALGGKFSDIDDKAKKQLKIKGGISVTSIKEGGILSKARVGRGFIITHINDVEVRSTADLQRIPTPITSIDGVYPDGKAMRYALIAQ